MDESVGFREYGLVAGAQIFGGCVYLDIRRNTHAFKWRPIGEEDASGADRQVRAIPEVDGNRLAGATACSFANNKRAMIVLKGNEEVLAGRTAPFVGEQVESSLI